MLTSAAAPNPDGERSGCEEGPEPADERPRVAAHDRLQQVGGEGGRHHQRHGRGEVEGGRQEAEAHGRQPEPHHPLHSACQQKDARDQRSRLKVEYQRHRIQTHVKIAAPFVTPAPEPGSMSSSRTRSGTLTRATAATGGEHAQPLMLPPEPRLGPGSSPGRRLGDMRCKATGDRCVHAVGSGARVTVRVAPPSVPVNDRW